MTAPLPPSPRDAMRELATHLGILLGDQQPGDGPSIFRFRTVVDRITLDLEEAMFGARRNAIADLMVCEVRNVQHRLFRATIEHIAKHDRDPLDRVAKLEAAARALLEAIGPVGWGDSLIGVAVLNLEQLLRAKPGAASFARDGYGKDPPR